MSKPAVLFLCTHNAARSQMAEAIFRRHAGDQFEVFSAGLEPTELHPLTLRVMGEAGYDMSGHRSKDVSEIMGHHAVRYAFIVCQQAAQHCPSVFPAVLQTIHWPFDDPSALTGTEAERLAEFRRIRDLIGERIRGWLREHWAEQQAPAACQSMNDETPPPKSAPQPPAPPKGFLGSLLERIDRSMKAAAEKKSASGCCGGKDGGKCC